VVRVRVKAQGLLNAAKWIDETYGREGLRDVLHACGPAVRERYTGVIAIDWHPVEELIEFVDAAERTVGRDRGAGRVAEGIGAAGARANMKGTLVRIAVWITRPEALMKRATGLWRQFNDEGNMALLHIDDHVARLELTGIKAPNGLFCAVLTGWCREVGNAVRAVTPVARHVDCPARGDARCVWEVRYARIDRPSGVLPPFD
jgi:hypothetical protein